MWSSLQVITLQHIFQYILATNMKTSYPAHWCEGTMVRPSKCEHDNKVCRATMTHVSYTTIPWWARSTYWIHSVEGQHYDQHAAAYCTVHNCMICCMWDPAWSLQCSLVHEVSFTGYSSQHSTAHPSHYSQHPGRDMKAQHRPQPAKLYLYLTAPWARFTCAPEFLSVLRPLQSEFSGHFKTTVFITKMWLTQ